MMMNPMMKSSEPGTPQTALIIEDEKDMRELLRSTLAGQFHVLTAGTGEEAVRIARRERPAVILMDLVMPEKDGYSACQLLRSAGETADIPLIVVSGMNDEVNRIRAFQDGADDFIAKPFTRAELLARVDAKVNRVARLKALQKTLCFGELTLDLQKFQVASGGQSIPVSVLEFKLLKFFVENSDRVLTRQEILTSVWRDAVVTDRTVDTHIASLRRLVPLLETYLTTVYGAGYMLKL
ncbi:MAG: response regulator transcription factor [Bdellovibrionales bacterium]|nr:response regulator transcription factor [Bdellovibrionales bacterium]